MIKCNAHAGRCLQPSDPAGGDIENVDTAQERITLAYFKSATWQTITVDRSVCANANKIVDTLSQFGIEVTSDNAKNMVRYISECVGLNFDPQPEEIH